jgi:hypothetical protein
MSASWRAVMPVDALSPTSSCSEHPSRAATLRGRVHKDANDLDRLRHDPLMKIAVGRCPQSGAALASQLTISRLENAPRKSEAARQCAALVDRRSVRRDDQTGRNSRSSTSMIAGTW